MINEIGLIIILLLPFVATLISFMIGRVNEKYRDIFNVFITGTVLVLISFLYGEVSQGGINLFIPDIMGIGLKLRLDMFRYIFVWVTALIWFLTTIYSTQYILKYRHRNRYYSFFLLTLGSTLAIFMSENLLNLFTFFEIMSITSYFLVIHDEDKYTHDAGKTYLEMAIAGGLILLMGLFLLFDYTGTLDISLLPEKVREIGNVKYLISSLIILGFGVKASIVPLHVWLPKAHPAAPTPASAILSGILLKTGIFGVIVMVVIIMQGDIILSSIILVAGFINMFLGGFFALFQRNIKRILAYSSMSQVGYILLGIGLIGILQDHNELAILGVIMHIFNHAIFKVLFFLGVGIIYMIIHDVSINVVRGFGKHKPILKSVFLVGVLAVTGIPGFNGFTSKVLLHEALSEAHHLYHNVWFIIAEVAFTVGSSFTVAYMLKIFDAVFIDKNEKYKGQYKEHIRKRAMFPLIVLSFLILYIGIRPEILLGLIKGAITTFSGDNLHGIGHLDIDFFSINNLKSTLITVVLGVIIYSSIVKKFLLRINNGEKIYINPTLTWISLEKNIYDPAVKHIFHFTSEAFHIVDNFVLNTIRRISTGVKKIKDMNFEDKKKEIKTTDYVLNYGNGIIFKRIDNKILKVIKSEFNIILFIIDKARNKMNSLIYSIFILATVLVIVLFTLVF